MAKYESRLRVLEAVERILDTDKFDICIETDENGELTTFLDESVLVTFCITFDAPEGGKDFRLFSMEFHSWKSDVIVKGVNEYTREAIHYLLNEFNRVYQELKQEDSQFKKAYKALKDSIRVKVQVNEFQVVDYLVKNDIAIPDTDFNKFLQKFKKTQKAQYYKMIEYFLEVEEGVRELMKSKTEVNNMQLGIEKDLRPIGQDLVLILQELHKQELDKKDLMIVKLKQENEDLKKKLGER